ncbi:MAG: hypothetical protein QM669_13715 [Siphonobacter sp.]
MQRLSLREERNFSEIINATFLFTFQNLKTLGPILLYFAAPFALVSGISVGLFQAQVFSFTTSQQATGFTSLFGAEYLLSIFFSWLASIVLSLVVSSYFVEYMDRPGEIDPGRVWRHVISKLLPTLGMHILYGLSLLVGAILCVLPAIYPYTAFSLSTISMVREELSPIQALRRSQELVQLNWSEFFTTFGLRLLIALAAGILGGVLSVPMYIIVFLQSLKVVGENMQWVMLLSSVLSTLGTTLMNSLVEIALGLQYFSLVEKKEGLGLMEQIQAIGQKTDRNLSEDY